MSEAKKTILVGVDGSERAPLVLAHAKRLAHAYGLKLTVLRAVGIPAGLPVEALNMQPEGIPALLLTEAKKELTALVEREVPAAMLDKYDVDLGTPWQVLCDAAKTLGVDYLVIGSHGYTLLDRVLGTTAARVVNHAPCSVLVVHSARAKAK